MAEIWLKKVADNGHKDAISLFGRGLRESCNFSKKFENHFKAFDLTFFSVHDKFHRALVLSGFFFGGFKRQVQQYKNQP